MSSRRAWGIAGTLVALHVALAWLARGPGIFGDEAVYVSLARSLRDFHYRELFRADLPLHRMYPPGYPLLLASWSAAGGERFDWLVLAGIAASAAALLLFFAAVRSIWGPAIALASMLALSLNPALIESSGWLLSESPFMFLTAVALWAAAPGRNPARGPVVAGTAAIAAALTRSAGITLAIALVACWLWQRQWRRAFAFAAVTATIVGGWLAFTASAPAHVPGSSYIADAVVRPEGTSLAATMVQRVSQKAPYLQHLYWQLPIAAVPGTIADNVVGMPIAFGVVAVGMWVVWQQWPVAAIYVAIYSALLVVWPWMVPRFITPLLPWLVLAALVGVTTLVARFGERTRTVALVLATCVLALSGALGYAALLDGRRGCERSAALPSRACVDTSWANYFDGVDYIRTHVPKDAVIVSGAPATMYWHTGHRAASLVEAMRQRASGRASYVLLSSVVAMPVEELKKDCALAAVDASFPPSALLIRLVPHGEAVDSRAACEAIDSFVEIDRRRRRGELPAVARQ